MLEGVSLKLVKLFVVLLCFSALYAEHIDVQVKGLYQGNFKAPPDIIYAKLYLDEFEQALEGDSLEITLFPSISHNMDTLQLFFTLEDIELSNDTVCLILSNAETLSVAFGHPLGWPDGEYFTGFNITIPEPLQIDSLYLKFKFNNFSWSQDEMFLTCKSNMVYGNSDWVPLTVGNIWHYEDKSRESLVPWTHEDYQRYHIIDSVITEDLLTRYLIEETRLAEGENNTYCCDTIHVDESNELVWSGSSTGGFQVIYPYELDWMWYDYEISKMPGSDSLVYYLYYPNNFPGGDSYSRYRYGVGLIRYWDVTWPWNEWVRNLTGARINGENIGWYTPLGIDEEEKPQHLSLNVRAYPNPFNAGIRFDMDISEPGFYQYTIYDVNGGSIYSKEEFSQTSGMKSFYWDGTDISGMKVSTGVYLIEVKNESLRQVVKIALLK